jgi:hypothetical protein
MSRTRAELVSRTAKRLGVLPAGQSLSAEDSASIDEEIDAMCADLASRRVYDVADDEDIPDEAFVWLADVLAVICAPDFGMSEQGLAAKGITRTQAEQMLRTISSSGPTYGVLETESF